MATLWLDPAYALNFGYHIDSCEHERPQHWSRADMTSVAENETISTR